VTEPPPTGFERLPLDPASWVDIWRGWRPGSDSGAPGGGTYAQLAAELPWRQSKLWRYDHYVTEPRLGASLGRTAHPVLRDAYLLLRATYGVEFDGPALAYYRDGRDTLGPHRDRELRYTTNTLIAILTFGARRPWQLTPLRSGARSGGAESRRGRLRPEPTVDLSPADGDLFVLGGRAQADWLHGVPPVPGLHAGRISAQWRWTSHTGPPERGPGYRAPRRYSPRASP
jgi:alkylated DNA repair dioxygenase AlkB